MAVWMAAYGDEIPVSDAMQRRLDDILLQNRAVTNPHVLRVLDYGTSEGHSFVVTDALAEGTGTLRDYLRAHGALEVWQVLRLVEQLTSILVDAHRVGFRDLCLTSDIIYIRDEKRFDIITGPLGIGLHRADILKIKDIPIFPDLMRHIPPWEYARALEKAANSADNPEPPQSDDPKTGENVDVSLPNAGEETANNPADGGEQPSDDRDDSVADASVTIVPKGLCPDVYNLAAVTYEALCGQHPCFSEDRDMCDAALTLIQGNPVDLDKKVEIAPELSACVMQLLKTPNENTESDFLGRFAALCADSEREKARNAEKTYVEPPAVQKPSRKHKSAASRFKHPLRWIAGLLLVIVAATAFVTYHIARVYKPVDLFALPELVPAVPDGIDVVISPRTPMPDIHIYVTSLADGSLILLGDLPYIHRHQEAGSKLSFVIADDHGHTMQLPVNVSGKNGLMMVNVDLNW